jgi:hypothetical protein
MREPARVRPRELLNVSLKPGLAGKGKIKVKGKRGNLRMPGFPLVTPVRVQLLRRPTPTC